MSSILARPALLRDPPDQARGEVTGCSASCFPVQHVRREGDSETTRDVVALERTTESVYSDEGIDLIPAPVFV